MVLNNFFLARVTQACNKMNNDGKVITNYNWVLIYAIMLPIIFDTNHILINLIYIIQDIQICIYNNTITINCDDKSIEHNEVI